MSQAELIYSIDRITRQLNQIDSPDDVNNTAVATAAATISAAPYSLARATDVGSCGRISFGRRRRHMPGIAVFAPKDSFDAATDAKHAALNGFDGDARHQPWSDEKVSIDNLSILANPADSADAAGNEIDKWWHSDDLNVARALSWANSPLIAILKHAADRSSMPDIAVWHGELTKTGRACFGREREGESGLAVFVPECSLWASSTEVVRAIEEPWW